MILSNPIRFLLFILFVLNFAEKSTHIKLLADVLPKPLTCYHIVYNDNIISTVSFAEIQSKNFPILTSTHQQMLVTKKFICDIYLIIFDSKEIIDMKYKNSIIQKLNEYLFVDTKVILIHNQNNFNKKLQNDLKFDIYLNIIFVEILLKKVTEKIKIIQIDVLAPFSNQIQIFKRKDMINSKNSKSISKDLENLFDEQVWDPIQRNTTFEVAYTEFTVLVYSENKELHGLEYRIIKELSSGWDIKTKSIHKYVSQVINIFL